MASKHPVLFVTHGSPMLAIEPDASGPLFSSLADQYSALDIHAILVVSAHWLTPRTAQITHSAAPKIIYDFGGFPQPLYQLDYPAQGAPTIAESIAHHLAALGVDVTLNSERGLDHGAWIPLRYLFPDAQIPTLQLSLPWPMTADAAMLLGQALAPLREQNIAIITSGSMTHNLYDVGDHQGPACSYIQPFVDWVDKTLAKRDRHSMANYRQLAPFARHAHPTEEHFLPLLVALGASDDDEAITQFDAGVTYQALAMQHYLFGQFN